MNVQDYLDNLPTGEVVCNRRVLAAMKRKGLISDYSPWCYMESHRRYYVSTWSGKPSVDYYDVYFCREPKEGELGSRENPYPSAEALWDDKPHNLGFYYKGHYFQTQYLDGCFNPYLIKSEPPHSGKCNQVLRRMSVFGAVV